MIKNLKRIAVLVVTAALAAVGSLSAAADGYILYAGYSFSLLDPVTLGDANGDGLVNINDVTAIQQHLAELQELSDLGAKAADINMDNKFEIEDATTLQMYLAEYVLSYPVGETV